MVKVGDRRFVHTQAVLKFPKLTRKHNSVERLCLCEACRPYRLRYTVVDMDGRFRYNANKVVS
ncbi:MAG: hypothetical protein LBJ00_03490 [Planctomycetaceae bacterium]|nr:hypothetical protein [Planctomycetaceae bacterium]